MTIPGQDRTLEEGLAKTVIGGSIPIATYERVSTADQRERATILTQYEELKRRVAAAPHVSVVERYVDDGITGVLELEERPAGAKLLADAKAGKFKELWVYKLDRLGRDDIDPLFVRRELEKVGVRVYSINESVEDPLMYAITVAIAAHERRTFMRRSRDGMRRTVQAGRFPGGIVPFGYVVPEKKEKARLVPDTTLFWQGKSAADLVVWMYELVAAERWTPARVAAHLNLLGVPTHYSRDGRLYKNPRRGKRLENTDGLWRASRVRALLLNTVYKGVYCYGKNPPKRKDGTKPVREILTGPCERLVSDELWEAAQASMASRRNWDPTAHRKHLMRSLIVCALCGLTYSGGMSHGKSWYKCGGKNRDWANHHGRCPGLSIDGSLIEPLIQRDICEYLLFPGDVLNELVREMQDEPGAAVEETERLLLESSVVSSGNRRKKAIQLNLSGLITDEELAEQLVEIDRDRETLEKRLADVPVKRGPKAERPVAADDLLEQLREKVEEGFTEQQWRDLFTLLVKRVVAHTEEIDGAARQRLVIEYNFAPESVGGVPIATGTD